MKVFKLFLKFPVALVIALLGMIPALYCLQEFDAGNIPIYFVNGPAWQGILLTVCSASAGLLCAIRLLED